MTTLDTMLQVERDRLDDERQALEASILAARERLQVTAIRLRHISALLETSRPAGATATETTNPSQHMVTDLAEEILRERKGEHMYYKDLAQEVQARGGELGGSNPANVLVARLVNDDRFVRPHRKGYYALRSDYPDAKNVGARRVLNESG